MPANNDRVPFQRVAIIGTGLIGGSFGLALRRALPQIGVVGFDRPDVLASACSREAVEETAKDIRSAVRRADLVYIALPIGATIDALPAIAAAVRDGTLVTDTGSTKAAICSAAQRVSGRGVRFLGGHPMAGKEESGIAQADADLFGGAPYALIGKEDDRDPRVQGFASLIMALGAQPVWCDAETHDWAVGVVSHMPQMLAVALARMVQDETDQTGLPLKLAGQGLQDMLRLAGSPYGLWRDVALTNTENIARALSRLEQAVEYLRTRLRSKELEREFGTANQVYKLLRKTE
ncbi:MAG: prephenate dehydrogenase/arogenate dehydrogenase family protein [Candidatus Acidiferrales bacterium]